MHYSGYVIDQLLDAPQRRLAADREAEFRRRRSAAGGDRRWSRTAPRG